ncbi:uncharacterized protein METZ01_LOCUS193522, partial [marine metagenome]
MVSIVVLGLHTVLKLQWEEKKYWVKFILGIG